ncbi:Arm DNA-binding domain-containing protein [Paraburkholderia sp. SIMBA_030]|uniref:Arm DNA-binding domain-containing protein n=1 Tax=Paraburkholderia sp. SIMBA_030 TaxID=3085773 RepID=UPI0039796493
MDGKRREVIIGRYPEIGVADARDRHAEYRAMVEQGAHPSTTAAVKLLQLLYPWDRMQGVALDFEEEIVKRIKQIDDEAVLIFDTVQHSRLDGFTSAHVGKSGMSHFETGPAVCV